MPWVCPIIDVGKDLAPAGSAIIQHIVLSKEDTARFYTSTKKHGNTITQSLTALITLSQAELWFKVAAERNLQEFKDVANGFLKSTHFMTNMNTIDQVSD